MTKMRSITQMKMKRMRLMAQILKKELQMATNSKSQEAKREKRRRDYHASIEAEIAQPQENHISHACQIQ